MSVRASEQSLHKYGSLVEENASSHPIACPPSIGWLEEFSSTRLPYRWGQCFLHEKQSSSRLIHLVYLSCALHVWEDTGRSHIVFLPRLQRALINSALDAQIALSSSGLPLRRRRSYWHCDPYLSILPWLLVCIPLSEVCLHKYVCKDREDPRCNFSSFGFGTHQGLPWKFRSDWFCNVVWNLIPIREGVLKPGLKGGQGHTQIRIRIINQLTTLQAQGLAMSSSTAMNLVILKWSRQALSKSYILTPQPMWATSRCRCIFPTVSVVRSSISNCWIELQPHDFSMDA